MAVRHPKLLILAEWLEVTNDPRQGSALLGMTMPDAGAHGFMWSSLLAVQSPVKYVAEKLFTSFRQIPDSRSVTLPLVITGAGLSFKIPCRWFWQSCCGSCSLLEDSLLALVRVQIDARSLVWISPLPSMSS